jgi:metallophosphoesterase superfamily enzyme
MQIAVISDLHWGARDHMPHARESVFEIMLAFLPIDVLVLNGDIVSGVNIYRGQEWEQICSIFLLLRQSNCLVARIIDYAGNKKIVEATRHCSVAMCWRGDDSQKVV